MLEALAQYEQRPDGHGGAWSQSPPLQELRNCLADPHQPGLKRSEAIKRIVHHGGQDAVDCLLGMLMVEQETQMRRELLWGLTKLRLRQPHGLEFPKRLIRRQIAKEVETFQQIVQVASVYRRVDRRLTRQSDPALGLLSVLVEETTEQIFGLLGLVYQPEDIYLIYHQLQQPDAYVRADAIELLDNLIEPGVKWTIFPVLDEDAFLERLNGYADEPIPDPKTIIRLLRQGVWDHNRWLSLVIMSLIVRLRLDPLRPELERAAGSGDPLIRQAARAAARLVSPDWRSHAQNRPRRPARQPGRRLRLFPELPCQRHPARRAAVDPGRTGPGHAAALSPTVESAAAGPADDRPRDPGDQRRRGGAGEQLLRRGRRAEAVA